MLQKVTNFFVIYIQDTYTYYDNLLSMWIWILQWVSKNKKPFIKEEKRTQDVYVFREIKGFVFHSFNLFYVKTMAIDVFERRR